MSRMRNGLGSGRPGGAEIDHAGAPVPQAWSVRSRLLRVTGCRIALWPTSENASAMVILNKRHALGPTSWLLVVATGVGIVLGRGLIPQVTSTPVLSMWAAAGIALAVLVVLLMALAVGDGVWTRRLSSHDYDVLREFSSAVGRVRGTGEWNLNKENGAMVVSLLHHMTEHERRTAAADQRARKRAAERVDASWSELAAAAGIPQGR